jgi:hypothetical protein
MLLDSYEASKSSIGARKCKGNAATGKGIGENETALFAQFGWQWFPIIVWRLAFRSRMSFIALPQLLERIRETLL